MSRSLLLLASAAALVLLGGGCRREQPSPTSPASAAAQPAAAPEPAAPIFVAPAPATSPPATSTQPFAPPTPADAVAPAQSPTGSPATDVGSRTIRVIAKQWEFSPREIRMQRGERVVLEVTSADVLHGLRIPQLGITRNLAPGVTERITIPTDTVGRFETACSVYCGSGHFGMRGTIIVE